jgi:hypothetical protein
MSRPAILKNLPENSVMTKEKPIQRVSRLDTALEKAKSEADGGLILFHIGNYYAAYGEDAEIVADVLGVQIQTPARGAAEGGACRKTILLTEQNLQRNLRLLRNDGNMDIWVADQGDVHPVDEIAELDYPDTLAIRVLGRS